MPAKSNRNLLKNCNEPAPAWQSLLAGEHQGIDRLGAFPQAQEGYFRFLRLAFSFPEGRPWNAASR